MWQAIGYVSSGFTLAAFLAAVAAFVYRSRLKQGERLIKATPKGTRGQLVESYLQSFHVDTTNLTKEQRYNIAIEQIRARAQRFLIASLVVCLLAIVAGGVAVTAKVMSDAEDRREEALKTIDQFATEICNDDAARAFIFLEVQNELLNTIEQRLHQLYATLAQLGVSFRSDRAAGGITLSIVEEERLDPLNAALAELNVILPSDQADAIIEDVLEATPEAATRCHLRLKRELAHLIIL